MSLILHPKITTPDKIRIWIGAFNRNTIPVLNWSISGVSTAVPNPNQIPLTIRSIKSVRPPALLNGDPLRTFSGIYEFTGCQTDTLYKINVSTGDAKAAALIVKTLPAEVQNEKPFNVLLVSCYHNSKDPNGIVGEVVNRLKPFYTPDMTILMGDQVYLDLPTLMNFPDNEVWLAEKFEKDYVSNWVGLSFAVNSLGNLHGYPKILACAPSVSIPDDHEYWNNYPHVSPIVGNSLNSAGREHWRKAADTLFQGFQVHEPSNFGKPIIVNVPPLSFFIADTRSQRDFNLNFVLDPNSFNMLRDWVSNLISQKQFGVFITGQSLFTNKVNEWEGKVADYELPNYRDYDNIMNELKRASENGLRITCITGDVHWGRVAQAFRPGEPVPDFIEIITSPSSLVETVGKDQWSGLKSFIGGVFGKKNPWPRHSESDPVPDKIAGCNCNTIHNQKGNQVAVLSFVRSGDGIDCKITYFPIHEETSINNNIIEKNLPKLLLRN